MHIGEFPPRFEVFRRIFRKALANGNSLPVVVNCLRRAAQHAERIGCARVRFSQQRLVILAAGIELCKRFTDSERLTVVGQALIQAANAAGNVAAQKVVGSEFVPNPRIAWGFSYYCFTQSSSFVVNRQGASRISETRSAYPDLKLSETLVRKRQGLLQLAIFSGFAGQPVQVVNGLCQ